MHLRAAGALLVSCMALPAGAQAPEVDLSLFRPASGGDGTVGVEGARPLPEGVDPIELQLLLDFALHPLRPPPPSIDRRLGGWISMQGRVDSRFSLSVQIPVTLREDGDLGGPGGTRIGAGLGDVRVAVRAALLSAPRFALAAQAALELATSQPQAFTGDGRIGVEGLLSGSHRLSERVELLGNALVRFRPPRDLGTARLGNEIGLRAAGIYSLAPAWRAYLELEAQTSVRELSFLTTPAEWRLGVRACALGRLAFDAAAGTRLSDGLGAPDLRVILSVRYTPAACAPPAEAAPPVDALLAELAAARALRDALAQAEEEAAADASRGAVRDAFKDSEERAAARGRALRQAEERDSDDDGIPDILDNCPLEKGPVINRGCPMSRRQKVAMREDRIDILEKVQFAPGSARIRPRSFAMLDQVVSVLKTHPDVARVQVEGHTDSTGSARLNTTLSQSRAESVVAYLATHGVERARLEARGFGPSRPLASNVTRTGREANRRVEFRVLERRAILDVPEEKLPAP
jgi:outer membrane protein OmpA-like peptidoglycan-associated protein